MFLTDEDYKAVCDDFEFEQLQAHTEIRKQAEAAAMEKISSYTRDRYDICPKGRVPQPHAGGLRR